jgi:hypothetical protein
VAVASSTPWTVSLRPARVSLELAASRLRGRVPRSVELAATLSVDGLVAPAGSRRLVLESAERGRWSRSAISTTDGGGLAVWRLRLKPGSYRLRVRFPGGEDLSAATSRPISFTIR